jgi:hypothetical protein
LFNSIVEDDERKEALAVIWAVEVLPSQKVGKRAFAMIPYAQVPGGKFAVSGAREPVF